MRAGVLVALAIGCGARSEPGAPPMCPPVFARGMLIGTLDDEAVYIDGSRAITTSGASIELEGGVSSHAVMAGRSVVWIDSECTLRRRSFDGGPVVKIESFLLCGWEMTNPSALAANAEAIVLVTRSGSTGSLDLSFRPLDHGVFALGPRITAPTVALDARSRLYRFSGDRLLRSTLSGKDEIELATTLAGYRGVPLRAIGSELYLLEDLLGGNRLRRFDEAGRELPPTVILGSRVQAFTARDGVVFTIETGDTGFVHVRARPPGRAGRDLARCGELGWSADVVTTSRYLYLGSYQGLRAVPLVVH